MISDFLDGTLRFVTRRRLDFQHRRRDGPFPCQDILPVELWDGILHEFSDENLLRAAAVCRVFNALCISVYLARNKIPALTASADIQIPAHILPALQLSCTPLPKKRLVCVFWNFGIPQHLAALRDVVRRSSTLIELTLKFDHDLFGAHKFDYTIPGAIRSRRGVMHALCAVLSAMAVKAPGPVVVVSDSIFFIGRAEDVAGWRLGETVPPADHRAPARAFWTRMKRTLRAELPGPMPRTIPSPDGETTKEMVVTNMHSATVYSHQNAGGSLDPYTLIIFNIDYLTSLYLSHVPLSGAQLSAILPTFEFPALIRVMIADGIDPSVLGEFLLRHPRLETFGFETVSRKEPEHSSLISPPIAHPNLNEIRAIGVDNINRAIACLHLSPRLDLFDFSLVPRRSDSSIVGALNPSFRLIGQRSNDAHLTLCIVDGTDAEQLFVAEDASAIAKTLHCFRSVEIQTWSVKMGLKTLPWLVLLPALRSVAFILHIEEWAPKRDGNPEAQVGLAKYEEQVKAVLSHVPEIVVGCSWPR